MYQQLLENEGSSFSRAPNNREGLEGTGNGLIFTENLKINCYIKISKLITGNVGISTGGMENRSPNAKKHCSAWKEARICTSSY